MGQAQAIGTSFNGVLLAEICWPVSVLYKGKIRDQGEEEWMIGVWV